MSNQEAVLGVIFHDWELDSGKTARFLLMVERIEPIFTFKDKPIHWSLPGGIVEIGEETLDATEREVHEETNLWVIANRVLESTNHPQTGMSVHYVECDANSPGSKLPVAINKEPDKHRRVSFLPYDLAMKFTNGALSPLLQEMFEADLTSS